MKIFTSSIAGCFFTALLFTSGQAMAERPAMNEHSGTPLPAPEMMLPDTAPHDEFRPEAEPMAEPEMDNEIATEAPAPVEEIVEQRTGDAVSVRAGETLPVRLLDFPRRGMSMDKVKNELGQPRQVSAAVGEPPITGWIYDDRTVYFEYTRVIHVVATR